MMSHPDPKAQAAADKAYRKAQRPFYKKKRFIIPAAVLVLILIGVSNSGNPQPATTPSAGGTATSSTAAQDGQEAADDAPPAFPGATDNDTAVQPGASVDIDGLALTATALKTGDSTLGETLCTTVSYVNGGDRPVPYNAFEWKLQDPNGAATTTGIAGSDKFLGSGELAPGGKVSGDVCFDNKSSQSGQFVLLREGGLFSNKRAVWINQVT